MGRRKEFENIANGLISSFISRNNDVSGYWGIGKLYAHMLNSGSMELKIDLIRKEIEPQSDEFQHLIVKYALWLFKQMEKRKINKRYLVSAVIVVTGFPNETKLSLGQMAPNRVNCKFVIKDNKNFLHIAQKDVWCRKHNPKRELKSAREY